MELYKWHKGTDLPDAECDCVVIWNAEYKSPFRDKPYRRKIKTLGCVQNIVNILGEKHLEFMSDDGDDIFQEDVVMWMPIEFPGGAE